MPERLEVPGPEEFKMFRKSRKKQQQIETLIGPGTRIVGDIAFEGGLHVDGRVEGNISAPEDAEAVLSVSESGFVEGSVDVPEVVMNGTVEGDVVAGSRVELGATARVVGNVVYDLIEMAIGAEVNGKLIHQGPRRPDGESDSGGEPGPVGSPHE